MGERVLAENDSDRMELIALHPRRALDLRTSIAGGTQMHPSMLALAGRAHRAPIGRVRVVCCGRLRTWRCGVCSRSFCCGALAPVEGAGDLGVAARVGCSSTS